jgi:hypothetical protein
MTKLIMASTCTSVVSCFDGHGGPPVQYKAHRLMQHVQGYSGSQWTPASGNYLLCIAPATARATGKQTTINKYTYKAGHFDGHGDAPVCIRTYFPMEEVQGFTRSHWTPPLDKYNVSKHKRDMATTIFFYVFYRQNRRKRSRIDAKTPVFNRGMTYQTKEEGLIKVSI